MSESVGNPIDLTCLREGAALVLLLLTLTGCISGESGSDREPDDASSATAPAPTIVGGTGTFTPADPSSTPLIRPTTEIRPTATPIPEAVQAAIARIAETLDLDPSEIVLVSYEQVRWPSTALGCPDPDRSYAQIVTRGYQLQLFALGELLTYHADDAGLAVVKCQEATLEP